MYNFVAICNSNEISNNNNNRNKDTSATNSIPYPPSIDSRHITFGWPTPNTPSQQEVQEREAISNEATINISGRETDKQPLTYASLILISSVIEKLLFTLGTSIGRSLSTSIVNPHGRTANDRTPHISKTLNISILSTSELLLSTVIAAQNGSCRPQENSW